MTRRVGEVMTRDVVMVSVDSTLVATAREMREHDIGDVCVMEDGRLFGMLTDRDIVVRAIAQGLSPEVVTAGDICTRKLVTVAPDDGEWYAVELMRLHTVRRLPVLDHERLVGVLSLGDVAIDLERDSTLATISAAPPNA
ncbi:CBS domain-containing protein [Nonomuraea turkmeniaca]|uniref:CBS domain-containing protein n=1 Tax=Nonomuraea turkmeniaca TaxID=103838 RepID=A0A5S4F9F5_9ACTN|nr:CBS domain-containing protein [Nonomuraea turkmeniaca]TMR13281.1 CBS domain-containing protein [Nonomuraea turkmeniaca]